MSTFKQTLANQRNSTLSTGPRTDAGKAISRCNAVKHALTGQLTIVPPSQQAEYDAVERRLTASLNPVGEQELQIAARIVRATWRLARTDAHQDNLYSLGLLGDGHGALLNAPGEPTPADAGYTEDRLNRTAAFTDARTFFSKLRDFNLAGLYEQRLHRTLTKDYALFHQLQARRVAADKLKNTAANLPETNVLPAESPSVMTAGASSNGFDFAFSPDGPPVFKIRPEFAPSAPAGPPRSIKIPAFRPFGSPQAA